MSNARPNDPRTKTSIIQGHMAVGDWRNAIRVAARLPRLDKHRAAILDAQGAYENPGFYAQIGKDAATLIEAGAAALRERFGPRMRSARPAERDRQMRIVAADPATFLIASDAVLVTRACW